ncbi:cupin domain-containing protein [Peribacillus sp. SCS-155]|uniref:cupin domain-containing protein n=1 Tax=Peribacillus sedimenti TaxID=3115297 RepID=UPI003905C6F7
MQNNNTENNKSQVGSILCIDSRNHVLFSIDDENMAYGVTVNQFPYMGNGSFVTLFLTRGNIREPHRHSNAWELSTVVSGEAVVSLVNPESRDLHQYSVKKDKWFSSLWVGGIG